MEEETEDVQEPLVQDNSRVSQGIVEDSEGVKTYTIDESKSYVDGDEIVLKYYKWKDMDSISRKSRKTAGKPLRKGDDELPWNDRGQIKFFYHDICTYIDQFGVTRMLRLKDLNLRQASLANVSVDSKICDWDDS